MSRLSLRFGLRSLAVLALILLAACSGDDGPGSPAPTGNVEFAFCSGDRAPEWVAVQDGDAAWVRLLPAAGTFYQTRFTTGRGGLAYVDGDGHNLVVRFGTAAELATTCAQGTKHVTGTAANIGVNGLASLALGSVQSSHPGSNNGPFNLYNVPEGPQDLFAARFPSGSLEYPSDRIILRRAQDLPAEGELALLDFESAEAFVPVTARVTAVGLDGPLDAEITSWWLGRRGATTALVMWSGAITQGSATWHAVPEERLEANDLNALHVTTYDAGGRYRSVITYLRRVGDLAVQMGPPLERPEVIRVTQSPYLRPRVLLASQAEYQRSASARFYQVGLAVTVTMSSAYLGNTPATWTLELPDFSLVDDWNAAWGLDPAANLQWDIVAEGGPNPLLGDVPEAGQHSQYASFAAGDPLDITAVNDEAPPARRRWGFPRPAYYP